MTGAPWAFSEFGLRSTLQRPRGCLSTTLFRSIVFNRHGLPRNSGAFAIWELRDVAEITLASFRTLLMRIC